MSQAIDGVGRSGRIGRLNRLRVAGPCEESWERMDGDRRARHCDRCQKTVHDFRVHSLPEIEALLARSQGQLCARLTRDGAGDLVFLRATRSPALSAGSGIGAPAAAVLLSAVLGASPSAADSVADSARQVAGLDPAPEPETGIAPAEVPSEMTGEEMGVAGGTFEFVTAGVIAFEAPSLREQFAAAPLVVLASVGETRAIAVENGYGTVETGIAIDFVIKGDVGLAEHPFRYMADLGLEDIASSTVLPFGETVLLFLARVEDGESSYLEIADVYRPPQTLTSGEVRAYRQRLLELAELDGEGAVEPGQLVDWLVAAVADPVTRNETVAELRTVIDAGEAATEAASGEAGSGDAGAVEAGEENAPDVAAGEELDAGATSMSVGSALDPELLALALAPEHAERLTRGLVETRGLNGGDLELFDLVVRWAPEAARSWLRREARAAARAVADGDRPVHDQPDWVRIGEGLGDPEIVRLSEATDAEDERLLAGEAFDEAAEIDPDAIAAAVERSTRSLAAAVAERLDGER